MCVNRPRCGCFLHLVKDFDCVYRKDSPPTSHSLPAQAVQAKGCVAVSCFCPSWLEVVAQKLPLSACHRFVDCREGSGFGFVSDHACLVHDVADLGFCVLDNSVGSFGVRYLLRPLGRNAGVDFHSVSP